MRRRGEGNSGMKKGERKIKGGEREYRYREKGQREIEGEEREIQIQRKGD